jgi:type II secretory pathway pseudopilin PulG
MASSFRLPASGLVAAAVIGCAGAQRPREDGKVSVARVQARQMATACEQYRVDKGKAPDTLNDLVPAYLELIANDPWGNKFVYPAEAGACVVVSKGPDGRSGSSDDISSKGELPTAYTK